MGTVNGKSSSPIVSAQVVTLTGPTAPRTLTLPDANATMARADAGQTIAGTQVFSGAVTVQGQGTFTGNHPGLIIKDTTNAAQNAQPYIIGQDSGAGALWFLGKLGGGDYSVGLVNYGAGTFEIWTSGISRFVVGADGASLCTSTIQATGFRVGANQVVGAQGAAVADASVLLADVVAQLNTLLARLRAHGLIAT